MVSRVVIDWEGGSVTLPRYATKEEKALFDDAIVAMWGRERKAATKMRKELSTRRKDGYVLVFGNGHGGDSEAKERAFWREKFGVRSDSWAFMTKKFIDPLVDHGKEVTFTRVQLEVFLESVIEKVAEDLY